MKHRGFLRIGILMAVVTLLSCRNQAEEIWVMHRSVFDKLFSGENVSEEDLNQALVFLDRQHEVTGILIRGNIAGALDIWSPTEETREDIQRLDVWFERNRCNIQWDEVARKILVQE